jgi:glycosyltransferase involved in cell wall biosynthesis
LIGEGSLETEIRQFISKYSLNGKIHIIRPMSQTELADWMNASDCLVLSSAFEGMPRVVVESLQCGLPVVSTDAGETKRMIANEKAGRLVLERNPDVFSRAVFDLLHQKSDRAACQKQVESFTASKLLERVYSSYRELSKGIS